MIYGGSDLWPFYIFPHALKAGLTSKLDSTSKLYHFAQDHIQPFTMLDRLEKTEMTTFIKRF